MKLAAVRSWAPVAMIALASVAALAVDPPDVEVNAVSGLIEVVDATWSGSNHNVRYTLRTASGAPTSTVILTTNSANDVDPRIALSSEGNAYVVWWRDLATDAIVYRKRTFTTGAWGPERTVGQPNESNSMPRIVMDEDNPWVAYQIKGPKSRSVGVDVIFDDPEPCRSILATTTFTGDMDIQIHYFGGRLWVSWVDTAQRLGYAQYDYSRRLWLAPMYEPVGTESVGQVLERIESLVLQY